MTRFLLASGSPRRRELFGLFGWPFDVTSANVDESPHNSETPAQMVVRLARSKASVAAARLSDEAIIIASDTAVSLDGMPLGKPRDAMEAECMLRALRGRSHQVHTGIALFDTRIGQTQSDIATTDVSMRRYSDDEIAAYIASGDPMDKAGAYAIQHKDFHPADNLRGCFANVMGLPLCHLARLFRAVDIEPNVSVPTVCQTHIKYACPVFGEILNQRPSATYQ